MSPSKNLPGGLEMRATVDVDPTPVATRDTERPPAPPPPIFMSTDSATRKLMPVDSGFNAYFPRAMKLVAFLSRAGNEKHSPGQPLRWAKEKSADEPDALMRHTLDEHQGLPATDAGLEALGKLCHKTQRAWRAMAALERAAIAIEREYLDEIADPDAPIPYRLTDLQSITIEGERFERAAPEDVAEDVSADRAAFDQACAELGGLVPNTANGRMALRAKLKEIDLRRVAEHGISQLASIARGEPVVSCCTAKHAGGSGACNGYPVPTCPTEAPRK